MRLAFISDLLYNLNITRRPCLVGYRIWYYKTSSKRYITSLSAYFGLQTTSPPTYPNKVHSLFTTHPKMFAGEEQIILPMRKYEAKQYEAAYYRIFGEKK
jgi:hypothetical protein